MRSEGNTGAYVAGRDVTVPTAPVIYVRGSELDDRHFHDLDAAGACRNCDYLVDAQIPDYGNVPEPPISADLECLRCGQIHVEKDCHLDVIVTPKPAEPVDDVVELPDYILAIAVVMRDTEGHPDRAVRAARKVVVTALQGLDRVLKASTSPSRVDAAPPDHVVDLAVDPDVTARGTRRKRRANLTDTEKAELRRRYEEDGLSTTQLGRQFGMSSTGVGNALRRMGATMRDRGGRGGAS